MLYFLCFLHSTLRGSLALPVLSAGMRVSFEGVRVWLCSICLPGAGDQPFGGACPCAIKNQHFLDWGEQENRLCIACAVTELWNLKLWEFGN